MPDLRRLWRNLGGLLIVLALLLAVTLLPPDTSLAEVRDARTLKACVPPLYPPLVTGDAERPGIDIELLRAVADRMGVGLALSENAAMGRDFNPRNWALNRAQCQVIAGGVVASTQTRSFLETGPPYAETGWAIISPQPVTALSGLDVGALTLVSGLDRIGLASFLRAEGAAARVVRTPEALVAGIADGTFQAGVTEAMLAAKLAAENGWSADWVAAQLPRYPVVFGLWKGDLTLKRAIEQAFAELRADGTVAAILDRYGAEPIT
ncbi:MAG TPA: transporter substrate-binding domain-containing protein [Devosia sp.]|jgi:polar amino acid transport system substrate-binding protein/cystine transport system substrate-binding protein/membrane-bound lytic murein transglycosylase F|nr:transporter substrate-binding domain-containing protein [Devosia sp.]